MSLSIRVLLMYLQNTYRTLGLFLIFHMLIIRDLLKLEEKKQEWMVIQKTCLKRQSALLFRIFIMKRLPKL